jgi:hypothetical protein
MLIDLFSAAYENYILHRVIFRFLSRFVRFGFAKSAPISQKKCLQKFDMSIIKRKCDAELESVAKSAKNHKKVIGQRFLHAVIQVKTPFSLFR